VFSMCVCVCVCVRTADDFSQQLAFQRVCAYGCAGEGCGVLYVCVCVCVCVHCR